MGRCGLGRTGAWDGGVSCAQQACVTVCVQEPVHAAPVRDHNTMLLVGRRAYYATVSPQCRALAPQARRRIRSHSSGGSRRRGRRTCLAAARRPTWGRCVEWCDAQLTLTVHAAVQQVQPAGASVARLQGDQVEQFRWLAKIAAPWPRSLRCVAKRAAPGNERIIICRD